MAPGSNHLRLAVSLAVAVLAGVSAVEGQTCQAPQCTFTRPPLTGTTLNKYYLGVVVTPSTCGFTYSHDCGNGEGPQPISGANCSYSAVGGSEARTYQYSLTVSGGGQVRCPGGGGSITVQDCLLSCDDVGAAVPATGLVGVPVTMTGSASATGCLNVGLSWDVPGFSYCNSNCDKDSNCESLQHACAFTFGSPGTYFWRFDTHATWSNSPVRFIHCTKQGSITIAPPPLVVGNITFTAATITHAQGSDVWQLDGAVQANGMLQFSGPVTFTGPPGSGQGQNPPSSGMLTFSGAASVATSGPTASTILSGTGQVWGVDGTRSTLTPVVSQFLTELGFKLQGVPLYLTSDNPAITLTSAGVELTPYLYLGREGDDPAGVLAVTAVLAPGGARAIRDATVVAGNPAIGLTLGSPEILYDGATDTLGGTVKAEIGFLTVTKDGAPLSPRMRLLVASGCVDSLLLHRDDAPLTVAPGGNQAAGILATDLAFTKVCSPGERAVSLLGSLCAGGAECRTASGAGTWSYHPPGTLALAGGAATFLGRDLGAPAVTLAAAGDLANLFQAGTFGVGAGSGGADVLSGALRVLSIAEGAAPGWLSFGSLDGRFVPSTDCTCPFGDPDCELKKKALLALWGSDGTLGQQRTFSLRGGEAGDRLWVDFKGSSSIATLDEVGVVISRTHRRPADTWSVVCQLGSNYKRAPAGGAAAVAMLASSSARSFTVEPGSLPALFVARGLGATTPAISAVTPAGVRIVPATVATLPGAVHAADAASRVALFAVPSAAPGVWTFGADNLAAADVELGVYAAQPPPVTAFTSVVPAAGTVEIALAVTPPAATTRVDLQYSRLAPDLPEGLVATGLLATTGAVAATWSTALLPSGEYLLVAVTDDGLNPPVTTVWSEPIAVDSGGIAPPTQLEATRTSSTVALTWTPSPSAGVAGYTVHFTDAPEEPGYPRSTAAVSPAGTTLRELDWRSSYRVCVAAFDAAGSYSPCSEAVLVGTGNPPVRRQLRR